MKNRPLIKTTLCVYMFFLCGCASYQAVDYLNSPSHHVSNGYKFLQRGMILEADREFSAAYDLNPQNPYALTGMAIVKAKRHLFDFAHELLSKAALLAKDKQSRAMVHIGYLRVYTDEKGKEWLEQSLASFNHAIQLDPMAMEAYYFMGLAYKESYNFKDAEKMFRKALEHPGPYLIEANTQARLMRSIRRYTPQTLAGKKAVLSERLTREQIASLLVQELGLEKWVPPAEPSQSKGRALIKDIQNRLNQRDIEAVVQLGIQGLELYPGHTFRPDELITRADLALMTQSIIIKATGKSELADIYTGRKTPFTDLGGGSPYFNAVMLNVTWGIMKTRTSDTEEFDPLGSVSGADALRVINRLKNKIIQIKNDASFNT